MIKIVKRLTQTTDMIDEELNLEDYVLEVDIAKFKDTVAAHGLEYAIRNKDEYDSNLLVDKLIPFLNLYIDKVLKANTTIEVAKNCLIIGSIEKPKSIFTISI